jgi:hypothetical protein
MTHTAASALAAVSFFGLLATITPTRGRDTTSMPSRVRGRAGDEAPCVAVRW